MLNRWYFSLQLLVVYLISLMTWKLAPSRPSFLILGALAVAVLSFSMFHAWRAGYFVDRIDLALHGWVIVDLALEAIAFEAFKLAEPFAVLSKFHDNLNFVGCAIVFSLLLGGYRWRSLQADDSPRGPRT